MSQYLRFKLVNISNPDIKDFQPMGANMGILPELQLDKNIYKNILRDKQKKYLEYSKRCIEDLENFLKTKNLC